MVDNKIHQNNIRLIKNTSAMYCRTFIVMFVNLYITRMILRCLGAEDYGLYSVVGAIVVLFSFLNSSLAQAVQRFITVECGNGAQSSINKVFSLSLLVQLLIAFLLILFGETIGLFLLYNYLNVPSDRFMAAVWVYQFSVITTLINIIRVPYEAVVVANERMTFFATASVIDVFMKLAAVLLIPTIIGDSLIIYSGLLTIVTLLSFIIYWVYCRSRFSYCNFTFAWDSLLLKKMMSFSGWSLCGSITNLATINGFAFLLNIFYGVVFNAALGIANQVNGAVNQFISNFQTSFRPQIIKAYASDQIDYFLKLTSVTSKFSYLLIFVPVMVLIINMPFILELWLGEPPLYTVAFCRLILVCCLFDGLTGSYFCAISATGNIKVYQILISISFITDLILSGFLMWKSVTPEYILFVRIATRGVVNMIIGLYLMKTQLSFNVGQYLNEVVMPLSVFSAVAVISCLIITFYVDAWKLLFISIVLLVFVTLLGLQFILNESEKSNLKLIIKKIIK